MRESISAESLKALVADGAAHDLRVMRGPDGRGWQLKVRYSSVGRHYPLRSEHELVRVFQTLESLSRCATKLGI
ncbi:hypothetical protein [Pseudomonas aeruginosa]|uniref:hypothetical protein n=1 Tax=Pseudomonas aeruginosa TaxID=287 RepID=UPI0021E1B442|nr:hypothetical protein [Pseudomonas aeruginosa]GLF10600.1 hypothetical protein VNPA131183_40590 [Pseudomonas aeruginosa]HCT5751052.1 hypothetical protein [Pseudomonas aeruginosa]